MEPEEQDYGCDVCGERQDWDAIIWLTASYGICGACYRRMTEEERAQAIADYE